MKYILGILICVFAIANLGAQDTYLAHINKPYYCQGEQILYKFSLAENHNGKEVAVNIRLYKGDDLKLQFFNKSKGNFVSGFINIPLQFDSGVYTLMFVLADEEKRTMAKVNEVIIPIYNDLSTEEVSFQSNFTSLKGDQLTAEIISEVNPQLKSRAQGSVKLQVKDNYGRPIKSNVSVSIIDKNLIFGDSPSFVSGAINSNATVQSPSNSLALYGKAVDETGQDNPIQILAAYSKTAQEFMFTKANEQGNFYLELEDFESEQSIQFLDYANTTANTIYVIAKPEGAINNPTSNIDISPIQNYIKESRTRRKLSQYFKLNNKIKTTTTPIKSKGFPKSNSEYKLTEYKQFENLGNFFRELSSALEFKKNSEDQYESKMTNPDSKNLGNFYLGETPLFVIDGKVSKSADFVGRLNFSDIEKVMLYYDKLELHQMFNAMGKNGAVVIDTKLPDFKLSPAEESDIFYLSGIQDSQEIFSFDQSTTNKTTPIFSPQIYWNPNLKTDDQGMLEFDFKHTDDLGDFVICIVSRSFDGLIGVETIEYQVKN